jgi:hypothetical protein
MSSKVTTSGFCAVVLSGACVVSYFFVWPLDFFKTKPTIVHSIDLGGGNTAEICQTLTNDFYYTEQRLRNASGEVYSQFTIAPDESKWWPWQCSQTVRDDRIVIRRWSQEFEVGSGQVQ